MVSVSLDTDEENLLSAEMERVTARTRLTDQGEKIYDAFFSRRRATDIPKGGQDMESCSMQYWTRGFVVTKFRVWGFDLV